MSVAGVGAVRWPPIRSVALTSELLPARSRRILSVATKRVRHPKTLSIGHRAPRPCNTTALTNDRSAVSHHPSAVRQRTPQSHDQAIRVSPDGRGGPSEADLRWLSNKESRRAPKNVCRHHRRGEWIVAALSRRRCPVVGLAGRDRQSETALLRLPSSRRFLWRPRPCGLCRLWLRRAAFCCQSGHWSGRLWLRRAALSDRWRYCSDRPAASLWGLSILARRRLPRPTRVLRLGSRVRAVLVACAEAGPWGRGGPPGQGAAWPRSGPASAIRTVCSIDLDSL